MRSEPTMSCPVGGWEARDQAPMIDPWWGVQGEGFLGPGLAVVGHWWTPWGVEEVMEEVSNFFMCVCIGIFGSCRCNWWNVIYDWAESNIKPILLTSAHVLFLVFGVHKTSKIITWSKSCEINKLQQAQNKNKQTKNNLKWDSSKKKCQLWTQVVVMGIFKWMVP